MTPEERAKAVEAWKELKRLDPATTEFLDPFVREFGMGGLVYVRFKSPVPEVQHRSQVGYGLDALVAAFPEEARRLLSLIDHDRAMEAEAKVWTGEVVHRGGPD